MFCEEIVVRLLLGSCKYIYMYIICECMYIRSWYSNDCPTTGYSCNNPTDSAVSVSASPCSFGCFLPSLLPSLLPPKETIHSEISLYRVATEPGWDIQSASFVRVEMVCGWNERIALYCVALHWFEKIRSRWKVLGTIFIWSIRGREW